MHGSPIDVCVCIPIIPVTSSDLERRDLKGETLSEVLRNYASTVWPGATKFGMVRQRTGVFPVASHALYPKYVLRGTTYQHANNFLRPSTVYMRACGMRNSKQFLRGSQTTLWNIFAGRPRHLPWPKIFDSNADARSVCAS